MHSLEKSHSRVRIIRDNHITITHTHTHSHTHTHTHTHTRTHTHTHTHTRTHTHPTTSLLSACPSSVLFINKQTTIIASRGAAVVVAAAEGECVWVCVCVSVC